jgi:Flp pilus assembly protein TadG
MWRMTSGRAGDERGAVVVVVALLSVALFGMAALVIDVGALKVERRQLQNGADAAALAVAQSCALGACNHSLAKGLADANTSDGAATVQVDPPAGKKVRVKTSTAARDGGTVVPHFFAQLLTGKKGMTVRASATAGWGPVGRATTVPLAISECEVPPSRVSTSPVVILFHDKAQVCGKDAPGGFGWLSGACPLSVTAGKPVPGDPGKSGPRDCLKKLVGTDILIPVFNKVHWSGNNATYDIVGFAALRLTGYRFPGDPSSPPPSCDTCIVGNFIRFVTTAEAIGGVDFGVSTVNLVE